MNIIYLKDINAIAQFAFQWSDKKITEYQAKSFYLPAGNTPIPLYSLFEKMKPQWLNDKELIQIDDILTGPQKGKFNKFLLKHLPNYYKNITSPQLYRPHQGDLAILGLGANGHIAFHEPHLPDNFEYGEVKLAAQTIKDLALADDTKGITYGVKMLLDTKAILLIIVGNSKKRILQNLKKGLKSPASLLLKHQDLTIICEESLNIRS
jgi:6-phosphogluconolactonase/glucosamine-6-phosphate isomerase/deaminase